MPREADKKKYAIQCCVCKRYIDGKTRNYVDPPQDIDGMIITHTYCASCKRAVEEEMRGIFDESKRKRT